MIQTFKNKNKTSRKESDVFQENYTKHLKKKQFSTHYLPENRKGEIPNSFYKDHHSRKENRLIVLMKTCAKILKETLTSRIQQYIKELWDWEDDRV